MTDRVGHGRAAGNGADSRRNTTALGALPLASLLTLTAPAAAHVDIIVVASHITNQKLDYWPTRTIFECFSLMSYRDDCCMEKEKQRRIPRRELQDTRMLVLSAIDRGMKMDGAAAVFGVGRSTIKNWLKVRRESGWEGLGGS